MLFSKPLQEITYQDLTEFCERWSEGVRVEYKQVLKTDHIPKVISSFANTVGGIWIIGVKTDESGRAIIPIEGFPREPGIKERITQSCYQSLYPGLLPDIKILDVPGSSNNVVVVVRVPESNEAPHAIENTTKVYIRTNSITDRIDLAQIDRVEYLLKGRREAELKRNDMLAQLATYSRLKNNAVRVRISPQYPHRPLLTRDLLTQRVTSIPGELPRVLWTPG
jgi:predicted HTH transcriptional regulator